MQLESAISTQLKLSADFGMFKDLLGVSVTSSLAPVVRDLALADDVLAYKPDRDLDRYLVLHDLDSESLMTYERADGVSIVTPSHYGRDTVKVGISESALDQVGFPSLHISYDEATQQLSLSQDLTVFPREKSGFGEAVFVSAEPTDHTLTTTPDFGDIESLRSGAIEIAPKWQESRPALDSFESNVTAVGISPAENKKAGYKVVVHTSRPLSKDRLLANASKSLQTEIDVRVVGRVAIQRSIRPTVQRCRPLQPGASLGHAKGTAGTLGGFVQRDNVVYAISCGHVIAAGRRPRLRDSILQPGPADGGVAVDLVARLTDYLVLNDQFANPHDIGLAEIVDPRQVDPTMLILNQRLHGQTFSGVPPKGLRVSKVGRTTGLTTGMIQETGMIVRLWMGSRRYVFLNQIAINPDDPPFTDDGDSGSIVWESDSRRALGVSIGGSTAVTYASLIEPYLDTYNLSLVN